MQARSLLQRPAAQHASPCVRWKLPRPITSMRVRVAAASEPNHSADVQPKPPLPAAQKLLLTFNEVEKLWVGVDRTLLSIGARGVTDKHANSLSDLLKSHTLVKVKFNGNPEDTTSQAEQLASNGAAQLLQLKGKTALYAAGEVDGKKALLSAASEKLAVHQEAKARKELQREERQQQRQYQQDVRMVKASRDASAARKRVDRAISSSTGRGPITKEGLLGEWDSIVDKLGADDGADGGRRGGRAEKRPWMKRSK